VGLEPTTLRLISCCHKSHTLYQLSYPGKGFIDVEGVDLIDYIAWRSFETLPEIFRSKLATRSSFKRGWPVRRPSYRLRPRHDRFPCRLLLPGHLI
jgi:hypothetical protein